MLKIYYGRENLQKDKFIFDAIRAGGTGSSGGADDPASYGKVEHSTVAGGTLLLVPDQFTLQAERDAFRYLGVLISRGSPSSSTGIAL